MRLLLVEDDRRIAADVETALRAAGYVVETVRSGEEAWFRGDTEDYGAIVLDLGLPGMDGLAVLKRWRANGRSMPVLILTARGSWAERRQDQHRHGASVRAPALEHRQAVHVGQAEIEDDGAVVLGITAEPGFLAVADGLDHIAGRL